MESAPREPAHVVVATHGHCFDGMCSAAMFTRLMEHIHGPGLRFTYVSCGYGPGQNGVDPKVLVGDENAILDFRFSPAKELTWYFDHHVSAFPAETDRAVFDARASSSFTPDGHRRFFHDGTYGSCTKLIADVGAREFGLDPKPTAQLVRWADMIDSAAFPDAKMAVERSEPVLQLMAVVEQAGDDSFLTRMIPRLLRESVVDVARGADVQEAYAPLKAQHESFIELVRSHATARGSVVLVDLTDRVLEVAGKFVTYALYPESAYSVIVSRSKSKCKISIGYNPWSPIPRAHNIAAICERHGGGGHPVVGAISLPESAADQARTIASSIATELSGPGPIS